MVHYECGDVACFWMAILTKFRSHKDLTQLTFFFLERDSTDDVRFW